MAFSPRSENEDQEMQKIRSQKLASDFLVKLLIGPAYTGATK